MWILAKSLCTVFFDQSFQHYFSVSLIFYSFSLFLSFFYWIVFLLHSFSSHFLLEVFFFTFFAWHFSWHFFCHFFVIQISSINNRRYRSFSELSYSLKGKNNNSTKTLNLESHFMSASTHESYEKDIQKLKNHLTSLIVISTNFLLHCHIDEFYVIFHSKCPSCVYLRKSINFFFSKIKLDFKLQRDFHLLNKNVLFCSCVEIELDQIHQNQWKCQRNMENIVQGEMTKIFD